MSLFLLFFNMFLSFYFNKCSFYVYFQLIKFNYCLISVLNSNNAILVD